MPTTINVASGLSKSPHGRGHGGLRAGFGDQRSRVAMHGPSPLYVKTKFCKFFAAGACTRNADCRFAHGQGELSPLPDFTRTRLCPSVVLSGACQGRACNFAHALAELRPRVDAREQAPASGAGRRAPSPGSAQAKHAAQRRCQAAPRGRTAPRRGGGPPGDGAPAPLRAQARAALAEALRPAMCLEEALLGAGKGKRAESPSIQPSGSTEESSAPTSWTSDGQPRKRTEPSLERQSGADGVPWWRLEVRNTFITMVYGAPANKPLNRVLSSPAALRHR
ncbi:unnamed protein product [Prorocentrum cordatum]|uniref:C3H1-type domain-containing protein n=1 Tax=Prorocentrum cordatum TaxID=2364126 RepID=A0ABN9PNU8_9DINO|nr:unnamed protein product [Polarella glacialis]